MYDEHSNKMSPDYHIDVYITNLNGPGFLAESWHVKNSGMFAVSCIGVAFLVVSMEFLRRLSKEYDAAILRQFQRNVSMTRTADLKPNGSNNNNESCCVETPVPAFVTFRATPLQQFIRSLIHAATFGVAYIVMLLAMYFNGFIIISIIIGSFIGKFLCDWMIHKVPIGRMAGAGEGSSAVEEPTVCCG